MMKLTNKTLSSQARDAILDMIDNNDFMTKLPSEQLLSSELGVSRNTIREALKALENEGIIAPRHGIGTFIIRDTKNIKTNIAVLDSSTRIIMNHGYTPSTLDLSFDKLKVKKSIASKLNLPYNSNVLYVDRTRAANGKPVVYVEDYISYIDGMYEGFTNKTSESIFEFLRSYNIHISFSNCSIYAVLANKKLKEKLSLKGNNALLLLKQVHYSSKGLPVMYSDSYFLSEEFEFSIIRKCMD